MAEPVKVNEGEPRYLGERVMGGFHGQNPVRQRLAFDREHYFQDDAKKAALRAATRKAIGRA
jgi:hypothetical protein